MSIYKDTLPFVPMPPDVSHTPFDVGILAIFPIMSSLFLIFFAFFDLTIQFFCLEVLTRRGIIVDGREAIFRMSAGSIIHAAESAVDALPVLFWYFVGFHGQMRV